MGVFNKYSVDGGTTFLEVEDENGRKMLAPIETDATSASKAYAVGEFLSLESTGKLYKVTAAIASGSAIVTTGSGANVTEDTVGGEIKSIKDNYTTKDLLNDTVGWTGKNLMPNHAASSSIKGIDYIVNSDGSVKANGTNNTEYWSELPIIGTQASFEYGELLANYPSLKIGDTYIFSGGSERMPSSNGRLGLYFVDSNNAKISQYILNFNDENFANGLSITIPSGAIKWLVCLQYPANASPNNEICYPMLCTKEEWDKSHEYKPYYIPVKDAMLPRNEQRVLGAKNLLNNKALTITSDGVTFTVNADGTITVSTEPSGATGNAFVRVANFSNNECLLNKGNYILNGTPNGGGSFAYFMYVTDNVSAYRDYGNGVEFAIGSDNQSVSVVIYVISGTIITTPITFKPMIRLASDPDDTYVPYAMTNKELTDTNALDDSEFTPAANISIIGNWSAKWGKLIQVALLFRTSAAINANTAIFTMPNYKLANGKTNGTVMGCPLIMQNGAVNTIIQCDMPSADGAVKFRNLVTLTSEGDYKLSMLFICK